MSEDQRDGTDEVVEAVEGFTVAVPTQMQLLSTWEVRKVPHNCVTRLCTLTVTRLQVRQCLEPSLPSLVLAVSMKTPHRFLRSNEIPLPTSGLLDIPLQLTFSLQYPHFIKRGGNVLQIRVQRRKRYRNRPLGGYKTLAMGTVEMSHVLQACYQGEVGLYSGKPPQPLATVTVGSLTSTPVYMEPQREGSSDEEEDEIGFSDYHGSDSDSGEGGEVYREAGRPHKHKRKGAKPSSMMLRLLGIKSSKNRAVVDELLNLQGEDPESAVAFASSGTESEEEEDPLGHQSTPPRPTLSGSDHCSVVSIPNSVRSAETLHSSDHYLQQPSSLPASLPVLRRYKSMERAIHSGMDRSISFTAGSSPLTFDLDIQKGRLWVVDAALEAVVSSLKEVGESVMALQTTEGAVATLQPLLTGIEAAWKQQDKFYLIAVVGEEWLVAVILQAMLQSRASDMHFRTALIPTSVGVVSGRMGVLDEELHALFPLDTDWTQMNSGPLLQFVEGAVHSQPLPVAQLLLHRPSQDSAAAAQDPTPIPFIFSVSIGSAEMDVEQLPSPPSSISISEATDLVVEYWVGKKEKSSLKVRSVTVTCGGQGLNVTMLKDKKGKGIRIRKKEKEGESGGSIVSLSAAQLLCRPSNKQETLSVVVDGVDWKEVGSVKMSANTGYSISLVTSTPHP